MANLSLRVDDETKSRLDTLVSRLGINASAVIRRAIDHVLNELDDDSRLHRDLGLSLKDRLILSNQYTIMAALFPNESNDHRRAASIFQRGYEDCYAWVAEHFYDEMSKKDCREVLEILDMYRALNFSFNKLQAKDGIAEEQIAFDGFDGNYETSQMGFARFILADERKYGELMTAKGFAFNSHFPSLVIHRGRVKRWHEFGKSTSLNADQIRKVIDLPRGHE